MSARPVVLDGCGDIEQHFDLMHGASGGAGFPSPAGRRRACVPRRRRLRSRRLRGRAGRAALAGPGIPCAPYRAYGAGSPVSGRSRRGAGRSVLRGSGPRASERAGRRLGRLAREHAQTLSFLAAYDESAVCMAHRPRALAVSALTATGESKGVDGVAFRPTRPWSYAADEPRCVRTTGTRCSPYPAGRRNRGRGSGFRGPRRGCGPAA